MDLHKDTLDKLNAMAGQGVRLSVIARDSGINYRWIERYRRGIIQSPSVHSVQRLYDWLVFNNQPKRIDELRELSKGKGNNLARTAV